MAPVLHDQAVMGMHLEPVHRTVVVAAVLDDLLELMATSRVPSRQRRSSLSNLTTPLKPSGSTLAAQRVIYDRPTRFQPMPITPFPD
jgi:hypothetical protein